MHTISKAALVAVLCLAPGAAFAETVNSDDVVVTATRTPTPLERLPARVEVIDREDIEEQSLPTLAQALGNDAMQSGGAGAQTSLFLRGANSNHTTVLLDGIKLNDESAPNGAYDFGLDTLGGLDRVEIVHGPASSVYGSEAIGGVVNMIPRLGAGGAFAPFGEASYGSFETTRALLGASGAAGSLSYGANAEYFNTEGYDQTPERFALHTGDDDGATIKTYTGVVRYDITNWWSVDALARRRESVNEYDTFSAGLFQDTRADDPDVSTETEQNVWRVGTTFNSHNRVQIRGALGSVDQDSTETDGGLRTSNTAFTRDFAEGSVRITPEGNAFFVAPAIMLGFSQASEHADVTGQFVDAFQVDEDNSGVYIVGQTGLGRVLNATVSLRNDQFETFGAHTTYQVGLTANFDSVGAPVRIYASYGEAFKAPSLYQRFSTFHGVFGDQLANPNLLPETSENWEVGGDWTIIHAQDRPVLQIGSTYFHSDISDLINLAFTPTFDSQFQNTKEAEIEGVETYVAVSPLSWLTARVSYAYTEARDAATERQLARRPRNSWRLLVQAQPFEALHLGADWRWVGERIDVTYDNAGAFQNSAGRNRGYNVGSLFATLDINEQLELFSRIDNLTDETDEPVSAFAGEPRSVTVGLRAKY